MSLTVFITIAVLACDFLIYALFQWTFGEKRRLRKRKRGSPKTAKLKAIEIGILRPYEVPSQEQSGRRQTEREFA
jgi:hypothetical protein